MSHWMTAYMTAVTAYLETDNVRPLHGSQLRPQPRPPARPGQVLPPALGVGVEVGVTAYMTAVTA